MGAYISNNFRRLDIYGRDLMFEEHNVQSFKTNLGSVLTMITFITIIIIGFLSGKEIYQREIPIVAVSKEIVQEASINLSDFPVIMFFGDSTGKDLGDINAFLKFKVAYYGLTEKFEVFIREYNSLIPCNPESFTLHKQYIAEVVEKSKKSNLTPYCINHESKYVLKNPRASVDSASLGVRVFKCDKAIDKGCSENVDIKTSFMVASIFYMNGFINPKNYSSPIDYYEESILKQVGNGITTKYYLKISNDIIESDNGWILESTSRNSFINIQSIREDFTVTQTKELIAFMFEMSKRREMTSRTYLKIQDLFAKLGGLFNALNIIFQLFLYDYIRFKFLVNYSKDLVSTNSGEIFKPFLDKINKCGALVVSPISENNLCKQQGEKKGKVTVSKVGELEDNQANNKSLKKSRQGVDNAYSENRERRVNHTESSHNNYLITNENNGLKLINKDNTAEKKKTSEENKAKVKNKLFSKNPSIDEMNKAYQAVSKENSLNVVPENLSRFSYLAYLINRACKCFIKKQNSKVAFFFDE